MSEEIKTIMQDIAKNVAYIQEQHTKDADANKVEIKNAQEKAAESMKAVEEFTKNQSAALAEEKAAREKLEAAILRIGNSSEKGEKAEENLEYRNAFKSYLRKAENVSEELSEKYIKGQLEKVYKGTQSKDIDVHFKTLRSDIGPQGGYFIAPQLGPVVKGRYFESTPMRELSDVMAITSNQINFPLDDQQLGAPTWDSEVTDTPETTTPQIGLVDIIAHQQACWVDATQTMLDDMPDVDTWLIGKIDDKFRRDENTQFVSGNGASKPKGFLSYAAWSVPSTIAGVEGVYERNKIEQIASGVSGAPTADALRCIQASLFEEYQENAVWVMKRGTWGVVTELKDGVGQYLINPRLIFEGVPLQLLNRPVVFGNDMQTLGANSLSIAYGDFKRCYQIVDRLGMRIQRNPFIQHPRVRFQAFRRTGGGVKNFQGIKLLKCGS